VSVSDVLKLLNPKAKGKRQGRFITMPNAIETVDLARRFGRLDAVNGLSLQVPAGSIFALIGPNGAGKTTTIKLLMNLLRPTAGSARVLGTDSRRLQPQHLQRIGYVSENQRLPDWMTPAQLFDYCRPLYPGWDDALCRTLQGELGLTSHAPLRTLSRGTRMKAALLSSLAYRPELILLDEPFTGLDPLVREELIRGLLEVASDRARTVLVSSHDIDEVERLADWVGYLDRGRLLFAEPVSSLLERFRLVEVVAPDEAPVMPANPDWLVQGTAGRTLRFVDTQHRGAEAANRIAAAFAGAEIRTSPLALREIFVTIARSAGAPSPVEAS
jgi:ABC-2 type transport system ATP-binding protein